LIPQTGSVIASPSPPNVYSPPMVKRERLQESSGRRSDVTLLHGIALGDEESFRTFYGRYAGRTLSLLRRICSDATVAEDLLQETFLAVWRKASTYRQDRGDPAGWLFAIIRNKALDRFRRRQPTTPMDAVDSSSWPALDPQWDLSLSLRQALGRLASGEREALEKTYFGGFTYEESAKQLRVPLGTLKSRIRTGLRKLHQELEGA